MGMHGKGSHGHPEIDTGLDFKGIDGGIHVNKPNIGDVSSGVVYNLSGPDAAFGGNIPKGDADFGVDMKHKPHDFDVHKPSIDMNLPSGTIDAGAVSPHKKDMPSW